VRYQFSQLPSVNLDSIAPPLVEPLDPILDQVSLPPPYVDPQTHDHDDVTPLMRIARHLDPKIILELGTACGNTVANLCKLCQARVITVNALPEHLSGKFVTYALTKDEIGNVYRRYGFENRVTQVYANTLDLDLTDHLARPCIDLAIIDACHDTSYVINDFFKVLPVLNNSATVLLHDTHPSMEDHLVGSYVACMKLRRKGFDIRHIRDTWWAIWERK